MTTTQLATVVCVMFDVNTLNKYDNHVFVRAQFSIEKHSILYHKHFLSHVIMCCADLSACSWNWTYHDQSLELYTKITKDSTV